MAETMTISMVGEDGAAVPSPTAWQLVLAIDCARPAVRPARLSLREVREVVVGRGSARRWTRDGGAGARRLVVEVPDAWMSTAHWRLVAEDGGWILEDAGSKNGTLLGGQRVQRAVLADGDVIESGNSLFLIRAALDAGDAAPGDPVAPAFRTLSAALARDLDVLGRVARSTVPILVLGETGTGKEVAARAIHDASGRPGQFTAVNCGALPATLVESELFGAKKGAFSGATHDRPGLVRAADGGTLFLDEIAELPEAAQAALLRVLQEGEVLALGANQPVRVDLRVVAATHQDLVGRVEDGRFRRDLFARLRGYSITLPPLRERREDIGLLLAELLGRLAPERVGALRLARAAGRALLTHDWPLNIRELEQVVRAALAVGGGDEIELGQLPEELRSPRARALADAAPPSPERFLELVRAHHGNVSELARVLGTSRSQVRRLAARHGVDLDAYRA